MENPRPSPYFGKFTAMIRSEPIRPANAARSSVGSNTTRSGGEGSATICRFLIKVGIDVLFEWFYSDAVHHVDKALVLAVAQLEVGVDQAFDDVGNVGACERRPDDPADPSLLRAADGDLVPLLAVLVDAKNPYVADVMVAAGVHAAGNIQVELADVVQVIEVVETALDRLGHGNGLGVGERAEIAARAGDDVGQEPDVRRRQPLVAQIAP